MKTIDIKGKKYTPVNERLKHFRSDKKYEGWAIRIKVMNKSGVPVSEECHMRCRVYDEMGRLRAEEHAFEKANTSFINKLSHVENCSTSVQGRALGQLGIGIDTSIASADDVGKADAYETVAPTEKKPAPEKPWMEDKDFKKAVMDLNAERNASARRTIFSKLDIKFRMNKDYRSQLLEIVSQLDINV